MIRSFSVHRVSDEKGPAHLLRCLPDLLHWKTYYIEVTSPIDSDAETRLLDALASPLTEQASVAAALDPAVEVQVAHKAGIVDNESDSVVELCKRLGIEAVAAKIADVYSSTRPELREVIMAEACNTNIEDLFDDEPQYETLLPQGFYEPMQVFDLRSLQDKELESLGRSQGRSLDVDQMRHIRKIQIDNELEAVSDVLLEALDARWSDHCAHTTWKALGDLLGRMIHASRATNNRNIVSMFHDNAGIWEFYDGHGIAIKAETHNGPSAVSAYFGQLTKVGGVLRDILGTGKGADPIGVFEYTATGRPASPSPIAGRPAPKQIASETIRAVKEYGNTFGVPMMSSKMAFDDSYRAKPFALGGSIGLIPLEHAQKGRPQPGDHVMLIGGLTGSDGIHGGSSSSAGAVMDVTAVQIGSPLEAIKFREAVIDLRGAGLVRAITDLGAAGLNSAVGEMGEDTGVWLNTAVVPLKTAGLPMWRILLSESQERMLLAIAPENLEWAKEILERHEVRNTVVGRFTSNKRYCVVHDESLSEGNVVAMDVDDLPSAREVGFDLPYESLDWRPDHVDVDPPRQAWKVETQWPKLTPLQLAGITPAVLAALEVADQDVAASQYDSSVQGMTRYGPGETSSDGVVVPTSYFAATPLYGRDEAVVFSTSFNPGLFHAHPVRAARLCFLGALTTQVLAGVAIEDICLCDNFYTPNMQDNAESWLVGMVNELAQLSEKFRTPFISGKDSSAGSTLTDNGVISVPPAVFISALGKVPDHSQLRKEAWTRPGNLLVRVGVPSSSAAGTVAQHVLDIDANDVDELQPQLVYTFLESLDRLPLEVSPAGRCITQGGILLSVIYGALGGDLAVVLDEPSGGAVELLFEHRCAAVIEVPPDAVKALPRELSPMPLGRIVEGPPSVKLSGIELLTEDAMDAWSRSFAKALA